MNLRFLSLLLLTALLGCNDGISTVPVSGKITKDGAPMPGIGVTLVGVEGTEAMGLRGVTNADGGFSVVAAGGLDGAPKGKYKVLLLPPITPPDYSKVGKEGPPPADKFPEKYTNIDKVTDIFVVGAGPNVINIDVSK